MFIEIKYWYLGTLYVIMMYNNYYVMKEKALIISYVIWLFGHSDC